MKSLEAVKVKDGYSVELVRHLHLHSYSDVLQVIRQEGLKIKADDSEHSKIYAT